MGFTDFLKGAVKSATAIGKVTGSEFPLGTYINVTETNGEASLTFTYPNKQEYTVTHDKVKSAEILAMGVIDIEKKGNQTTSVYGTKYKVEFTDGKVAILTVGLGDTLYKIERVLF